MTNESGIGSQETLTLKDKSCAISPWKKPGREENQQNTGLEKRSVQKIKTDCYL